MPKPLPGQLVNIILLATSQALFLTATITVMTFSSIVGQELTTVPELVTLPIAVMMLGTVTSTVPASLLMKRIGRRNGFLIGTVLGGMGGGLVSVLGIALSSFWIFCLGNGLIGLYQGFAMYYRFAAAEVAQDSYRSQAVSLVLAGGIAAALIGPLNANLSRDLISSLPSAGPYLVIAIAAFIATVLISRLRMPTHPATRRREYQRPLCVITRQIDFRIAVLASALGFGIMTFLMTATPLAMRAYGFAMSDIALVMQWHFLGMNVPSLFTGHFIARLGVPRVLSGGVTLLLAAAVTAISGQTFAHFFIALLVLGIGWNFLFVAGSVLLTHAHFDAERGKVQGVNDLLVFSMVAIGSLLSGTLFVVLGWTTINWLTIPIVLAATLLAWVLTRRQHQPLSRFA